MNKTQANRTQTAAAAAAAGYMGECFSPYASDSEGKRGDKTPLIMASTTQTTRTEAYSIKYRTCSEGCFMHDSAFFFL